MDITIFRRNLVFFLTGLIVISYLLLPCLLWAADANPDSSNTVQGYISAKYIYRSTSVQDQSFTDQDVFGEMRLDYSSSKENRYEAHFFGAARSDLDGDRNQREFFPFEDIGDARNHGAAGYLYEAHFDMNSLPGFTQLRFGRQSGTRDEPIFFDGLGADIGISRKLNLTVYGGHSVHFYELDNEWGSDKLGGMGLDFNPFASTGLSLDYLHVEDERGFFSTTDQKNNLISYKLWQRFGSNLKATAKLRYMNGDARDVKLRAINVYPESDLEFIITYFKQFETQNELSNEFSPYYDVLGQSHPYQTYDIKARKMFGSRYALDAGYFKRTLLDEQDRGSFNREYKRAFADLEITDLLINGLSFTLIEERWNAGDKQFNTTGADATYTFKNKKSRVSAGTYYSLYKYDYYIEFGERTRVRTYYVNGKFPVGKKLFMNATYEHENSLENYQTMKLGMRYDF